jgi:ABC-type amino acid transport system permease subunit
VLAVEYLALLLALTRIAQFVERRVKPE